MSFDPWTLGFQAVNVVVLVWLLQRFFWTPVAATITARQVAAATLLDDANAERSTAKTELAEVAKTRSGLAAEANALLADARKDAETARDAVLAKARSEAETLHDTAKAARVRAAETLKANAMTDAQDLALVVAGQLLARLGPASTDAAFLGWLVDGIAALSDADRKELAGGTLDVISATPQDSTAQDHITKAITAALGQSIALNFMTDPDLIAGHELHSPHFILRNSWAADLVRIKAALDPSAPDRGLSDAA
jgi:F-type H+-transporting ATPase subunit b